MCIGPILLSVDCMSHVDLDKINSIINRNKYINIVRRFFFYRASIFILNT